MANVSIKFNNKEFLLSCEDGQEEHLEELLIQINQKFNDLKNNLGNLGENKLLLITAVKIMDEYYETKKKVEQKKNELKDLSNKFRELKSLIYDYRDKKNEEINELNTNHLNFKNEIEANQKKYEQLIDEAADEISNFVEKAKLENKTAIFFGFQNPSPIEDDIGLIEIVHTLGVRFMQLTYNNQSLLATGCYEDYDAGLTRMGRQVVAEMNRVGLVVDMSHSGERSTFEAIEHSTRPITISHANPASWHKALRNRNDTSEADCVEPKVRMTVIET